MTAVVVFSSGCWNYVGLGGNEVSGGEGPQATETGIRFSLYSRNAESVAIAGNFNNWSKSADQLSFDERKGLWEIVIPLPPGEYEYKFVIDGKEWIADPGNPEVTGDGFGGYNSIIEVEEKE
ncbi:MAG: glycogen-binding domain-containing protein [Candidatus Krumholzibacteriales bacterium]